MEVFPQGLAKGASQEMFLEMCSDTLLYPGPAGFNPLPYQPDHPYSPGSGLLQDSWPGGTPASAGSQSCFPPGSLCGPHQRTQGWEFGSPGAERKGPNGENWTEGRAEVGSIEEWCL